LQSPSRPFWKTSGPGFVARDKLLVNFPVFHDDQEIPRRILDQFDVVDWIAV
jgi:hypothetical protein